MNIPINNLYYLLLYAWDALEEADLVDVTSQPETRVVDLLASVLNNGIQHLLRRGLDRGYRSRSECIPGVRGKIDVSGTVKAHTLKQGRAVCEFDELSHDVLHNRLLRSTLRRLLRVRELAPELRERLAFTYRRFPETTALHLSNPAFRSVQLHRNIAFYRFVLDVCLLIHQNLLVDENTGKVCFRDFTRDERRMRVLFERFLRNFYRREQSTFSVGRERIRWEQTSGPTDALRLLPTMTTDISLTGMDRKIVIDAKFYQEPLQRHFAKPSVRSSHLYQLFAYLKNLAVSGGVNLRAEGMLLYPVVGERLDLSYNMHGHSIRVCTVDLGSHWNEIRRELLGLVGLNT